MARDFKFHRVDDQHYEVIFLDVRVGIVYYRADAWSRSRWFIEGGRVFRWRASGTSASGCVNASWRSQIVGAPSLLSGPRSAA